MYFAEPGLTNACNNITLIMGHGIRLDEVDLNFHVLDFGFDLHLQDVIANLNPADFILHMRSFSRILYLVAFEV